MKLVQNFAQKVKNLGSQKRCFSLPMTFVPESDPVNERDVDLLESFVNDSRRLFIITGAGLSTESGLPDYRSKGVGLYERTDRRPMMYQEFIRSSEARRKYWARNFVGWPRFSSAIPNESHRALYEWEQTGRVLHLVTQNVDRLHHKAGKNI